MSDEVETPDPGKNTQANPESTWPRLVKAIIRRLDERRTKKPSESTQDRAARRTAMATIAIAIFTAVAIVFGGLQFWAIKGQLDEMRAEQRPWVATQIEVASDFRFVLFKPAILFLYHLKNVGKLPATNVRVWLEVIPYDLMLPSDPLGAVKRYCKEKMTGAALLNLVRSDWGGILFPDNPVDQVYRAEITKSKDYATFVANGFPALGKSSPQRKFLFAFISCVDYQSASDGSRHQTGEAFGLLRSNNAASSFGETIPKDDLRLVPIEGWTGQFAN